VPEILRIDVRRHIIEQDALYSFSGVTMPTAKELLSRFTNLVGIIKSSLQLAPKAKDVEFLAFYGSLLPIPGVPQAAQVVQRIAADKVLQGKLDALKDDLIRTNSRLSNLAESAEWFYEAMKSAESMADRIQSLIRETLDNRPPSDFIVETTDWSIQRLIDVVVTTDRAAFIALSHSMNVIQNSKINAQTTHLRASGHSSNVVTGTEFSDGRGSVRLQNIAQVGEVSLQGASSSFHGVNSGFHMGQWYSGTDDKGNFVIGVRKPTAEEVLNVQCPKCNNTMRFTRGQLQTMTSLACTACSFVGKVQ
jgi:hypothetical protein